MVKTYQNLVLFGPDPGQELSILESRKHNQAGTNTLSGGLQIRSTPQRIDQCRKAGLFIKRTSEILFIDKWYEPGRNKVGLGEYGTEARGLDLSCDFVYASILDTPVNGSLRPKGEYIEALFKVQLR